MPIIYKEGDMFTTKDRALGHGCNTFGQMGAGVAKIMKKKFPKNYANYKEACKAQHIVGEVLGRCMMGLEGRHVIFNLMTQNTTGREGRHASYDAIDTSVKEMFRLMRGVNLTHVSMPKIGAGLGGADWQVVEAIIQSNLTRMGNKHDYHITVTVWSL